MHSDSKRCIQTAKQVFPSLWRKGMSHFKNITSLPYGPSWRAAGQLQDIFCSFQMLEVQIPSRPMLFSTISKENNVSEKKKRKTSHVLGCGTVLAAFRSWRLHKKIPFPLDALFGTLFNVPSGMRPVVAEIWMNTWSFTFPSVNILGYSEASVSECGDTPHRWRQVKTKLVWQLGTWIVGYGGTQPNKWQSGTCCLMWLKTAWPITRHFLSVSHALLLSEGSEVTERKHV